MKKKYWSAQLLLGLLAAAEAHADIVVSPVVNITSMYLYSDYGGGDVTVQVSSPTAGCEAGFWLRPTDPGFKTLYAQAVANYTGKLPIQIWAYSNELWSGSSGSYCRVYAFRPQ